MVRKIRKTAFVCVCIVSVALIAFGATWQAATHIPEFYETELTNTSEPVQLKEQVRAFEQSVLDLGHALQSEGDWKVVVSDEQINAWLATELATQFPHLMRGDVSDPRVHIQADSILLACQYRTGNVSAVISLELQPFATKWPNVVGVKFINARVGAVPGVMGIAMEQISQGARRSRIQMRWGQVDQVPAAIVQIPDRLMEGKRLVNIKHIGCVDGQVQLAGSTIARPAEATEISSAERNVR